ncbi:unnamed protein product [Larinioides sclopetarius]|uniref:Uncharacterized protein n=1 Tax=Larinioides sclopetarius TaxID=280406 RepID=A0AAV2BQ86_9ARAC
MPLNQEENNPHVLGRNVTESGYNNPHGRYVTESSHFKDVTEEEVFLQIKPEAMVGQFPSMQLQIILYLIKNIQDGDS